jgi:iron(III) transport system permease protein
MSAPAPITDQRNRAAPARRQHTRKLPFDGLISLTILLVALFLIAPLAYTIMRTLSEAPAGWADLMKSLDSGILPRMLGNTLIVVMSSALLATIMGAIFAVLHERTDGNLGSMGELLPLAPLIVPPIAGVIGWAILLDPNVGVLNMLLRKFMLIFGVELGTGPLDIYSRAGLIYVTALYLVPYVFLVVSAALRNLDSSIEEASRVSGAPPIRTLARITLPAIRTSLLAGFILAVIAGIGLFSVPIVLGTAARVEVVSVFIYRLLDQFPPKLASGLMLSAGMVALVQILLVLQRWVSPIERGAMSGGRSGRIRLGLLKRPAQILTGLYLMATSILPVAGLLVVSFQSFWTPIINPSQFSLANYRFVLFENGPTSRAFTTSFTLGAATATLAMLIAAIAILGTRQRKGKSAGLSDFVMNLPATLPHTVIGIAFLISFTSPWINLYGTIAILLMAYIAMALPFAARAASSAASGIGMDLAEASRIAGASPAKTFARILFPLALPGLLAGWIIVFIHTAGEVTASSLLAGARNPVIGRIMTELWVFGSFPQLAAMSIIVTLVTSLCVALMLFISRRSGQSGWT